MFKEHLRPGARFVLEKKVTERDTATAYGSGGVDVFATPAMIALMENTALQIDSLLEEGYKTVGTEVCVKHIKATPVGDTVRCIANLTAIDGPKLTFEVEAFDSLGKIGYGTHRRYVVKLDEFLARIKQD